jgi:hypothetical protein
MDNNRPDLPFDRHTDTALYIASHREDRMNRHWVNGWLAMLPVLTLFFASIAGCYGPTNWLNQIVSSCVNSIWQDQDDETKSPQTQDPAASKAVQGSGDQEHDHEEAKAEDLIKDWDKPDFAIFYTGNQQGYIEPCGCTGLENQKGGLMRRHLSLILRLKFCKIAAGI